MSFVSSFVPVLIARLFLRVKADVAVINGRVSLLWGSRAASQPASQPLRSGEVPMKFILGSIPNGAGTMVLWFLWSLIRCGSSHFQAQSSILHKAVT